MPLIPTVSSNPRKRRKEDRAWKALYEESQAALEMQRRAARQERDRHAKIDKENDHLVEVSQRLRAELADLHGVCAFLKGQRIQDAHTIWQLESDLNVAKLRLEQAKA